MGHELLRSHAKDLPQPRMATFGGEDMAIKMVNDQLDGDRDRLVL